MTTTTTTTPTTDPKASTPAAGLTAAAAAITTAAEAAAVAAANKISESEALALAQAHRETLAQQAATEDLEEGDNVLVSGVIAGQVNPLSGQNIPHGRPVIAKFDRWIAIQLGAEVLKRHKL